MKYFTSDLHLGHANIIQFCGRPFKDTNHMDTAIINTINETVTPDDELWILGDVAMGQLELTLPRIEEIICPVVIVAGNHDRCHPAYGATRAEREEHWLPIYSTLRNVKRVLLEDFVVVGRWTIVRLNHFPYQRDERHGDRFALWQPNDCGDWLLHGHVHQDWRQRGRQINVGIDAWGGSIVSEETLFALIEGGERDLPHIPWGVTVGATSD